MGARIGGHTKIVSSTPTIDTAAYASGDLIGGKITLSNIGRFGDKLRPGTGVIHSVIISDDDKESVNIDVVFFDADPTNTTFTDNAAFAIADADLTKVIGVAAVTDWKDFSDNSIGQALNVGMAFDLGQATTLYAALVARGAPTYTATDDLTLRVGVLQD